MPLSPMEAAIQQANIIAEQENVPSQLGAALDKTQASMYSGVEAAARMTGYDDVQNWARQNAQENLELAQ